jgi:hypothetical protein
MVDVFVAGAPPHDGVGVEKSFLEHGERSDVIP